MAMTETERQERRQARAVAVAVAALPVALRTVGIVRAHLPGDMPRRIVQSMRYTRWAVTTAP